MATKITIIGSGPGGYVAALRAAQWGAEVVVIEDSEVGGTCLNWGCIPTKTLVASAAVFNHVRNASYFGIDVQGAVSLNLARIRERRDNVVSIQVKGIKSLFKSAGITLISGRGVLLDPRLVRVAEKDGGSRDVSSDKIIIATGSRPALIHGFPDHDNAIITSDDAVLLKDIPERLIIIGAGVIGCEFAFIYRSFGAEVTLVEMGPRALITEDEEISSLMERELKKAGIKLMTGAKVADFRRGADGVPVAILSNDLEIRGDKVLVSIGRTFNSEKIGLEETGVQRGRRGEIIVNSRMETNVPGVYAIGDVTGKILLAHVASYQGRIAADNAMGKSIEMNYEVVPSGIFTMPEIGSVGLREHQAREAGLPYRVGKFPFRGLAKAHAMGEIAGLAKVITHAETDRVLGVHLCGAHAADLIHEGALAMHLGGTARQIGSMIHAHPTLAEGFAEAAEDVHDQAVHLPLKK